jgi:phenylpropionate dioxygenase-like ring-hydroxylating dioxygenase large terminal subunit
MADVQTCFPVAYLTRIKRPLAHLAHLTPVLPIKRKGGLDMAKADLEFSAPEKELPYDAWTPEFEQPLWKDPKRQVEKRPYVDLGAGVLADKQVYWSQAAHEREWHALWRKTWHLVGHLNDVPKKGDFLKADLGPESFLVTRGAGNTLTALYNFCTHRGTRLVMKDFGSANKFVCPYHRWEFETDGAIKHVPQRETFRKETLCRKLDMPRLRVDTWRGWIFVTMDEAAPTLIDYLGKDFTAMLGAYDLEKMVRVADVAQTWPVNWKTAHEAFIEGYHVQATHPQLIPNVDTYLAQVDLYPNGHNRQFFPFTEPMTPYEDGLPLALSEENKLFLREAGVAEEDFPESRADVPQAVVRGKRNGANGAIDYGKFTDGQLIDDWSLSFFPGLTWNIHPEGVLVQSWRPHATDPLKCEYLLRVYAVPGISELPSYMGVPKDTDTSGSTVLPRSYADADDLSVLGPVVSQDRVLIPRLQAGMRSEAFEGAILGEQELRIRAFYDEYYKYMNGLKR